MREAASLWGVGLLVAACTACTSSSYAPTAPAELQPACFNVSSVLADAPAGPCDAPAVLERKLFSNTCGGGNCHGAAAPQLGVDLQSGGIVPRLRGAHSRLPGCQDRLLIDAAQPVCSFLLEKMTPAPTCGDPMPFGSEGVAAADLRCAYQWIVDSLR